MGYDRKIGAIELRCAVQQEDPFENGDEEIDSKLEVVLVQFSMVLQEARSIAMKICFKNELSY